MLEVHYTEDGLSYTSEDLVRRGPSGRLCIEDDERLAPSLPTIGVREDLFEEMPLLLDISIGDEPELEVECIPPPLLDIVVVEDEYIDILIIEPEIVYIKTIINIDLSNE